MAKFDGVIDRRDMGSAGVIDGRHPAVVKVMPFMPDNGKIEAGEIIALNSEGKADFYDAEDEGTLREPVGVSIFTVDTGKDSLGSVLVHGTVIRSALKNNGIKAEAAAVKVLETNTQIWAF
ncbi:hypothetical protein EP073_12045 [Geovibrio thiophilus]|uniref:Head decoration protein n=1 Tax=Geovibrio thiophilus TaxID=139438 RepID=A0A410K1I6_9BACT|nr:hypothetical protein [Geovibrio thiophilus]QAR34108.1 hypothetical protein EP073_12045 [Geovibrio thiophilus]